MKTKRLISILISALFLLTLVPASPAQPVQAQTPDMDIAPDTPYVPGEVIIRFEDGIPTEEMGAKAAALAGSVSAMVAKQGYGSVLLSMDPAADVESAVQSLSGEDGVAYAQPNYIYWLPESVEPGEPYKMEEVSIEDQDGKNLTFTTEQLLEMRTLPESGVSAQAFTTYPNDEYESWGNDWIEHDIIWVEKKASPQVCVIDTGVDYKHPDLKGRVINGYDFINGDGVSEDDNGHGTHIAGIISAKVNNNQGLAGISNGKVLAVKALGSEGWGTDFDITSAIYYCAGKSSIKIINLSVGGPSNSQNIYDALNYAINLTDRYGNPKGKLVVAAAGNSASSNLIYPAAWAIASTPKPNLTTPNTLHQGLLSVGAVQAPWLDTWVDLDNDGEVDDETELYNNCATNFSNYGSWVEIVAPGDDIYSTMPVSYPFHLNFYLDYSSGYDWLSGTSQAAPHVAASAARVWSVFPTETNEQIEDRLLNSGNPVTTIVDPAPANPIDPENAWADDTDYGPIDEDPDGIDDYVKAPFCWPDDSALFGADQDTSAAVYLNIAAAMNRGAIYTSVADPTTGLPLVGAKVQAVDNATGKTKYTGYLTSSTSSYVNLLNLPADVDYRLRVYKSGRTSGYQQFNLVSINAGEYLWNDMNSVDVPSRKKDFSVIAMWPFASFPDTFYDLDLYVWLPAGAPSQVIGKPESLQPESLSFPENAWPGTVTAFPYARWFRDGGSTNPSLTKAHLVEATAILRYKSYSYPYYTWQDPFVNYEVMVAGKDDGSQLNDTPPIMRVWYNGRIIHTQVKTDVCDTGENWWHAFSLGRIGNTYQITEVNSCGEGNTVGGGGVWPYGATNAILTHYGTGF